MPIIVTRLLLSPFCRPAPPGVRGDVVRVSDGQGTVYLLPDDVDTADEAALSALLAAGTP